MALVSYFIETVQRPFIGDAIFELLEFMATMGIALAVGVVVGWVWKPKWACPNADSLDFISDDSGSKSKNLSSPSKSEMVFKQLNGSISRLSSLKLQVPTCFSWIPPKIEIENSSSPSVSEPHYSSSKVENEKSSRVNLDDLKHLHKLVEVKDGGPSWIQMMERSAPNMSYQAWRRDPETGPPQYRSRTVYEDATPEMVRDFFWDDEFRRKWDDMLISSETLDECRLTGTMLVHWVRKFPFFCSDREYIIGRRIWVAGQTYYCITKGVQCASLPRSDKPKRVDLYYSSWCIRAAESSRDGQMTACEVLLFHHEDMGIPWEIAKLGVRQGMWGAVKKIDPGLRAYQKHRASGEPLSRSAAMAQINANVILDSMEHLDQSESGSSFVETQFLTEVKTPKSGIRKVLVVGGAIALVCSLDRGFLSKAVIFCVARRFSNIGRKL